MANGKSVGLLAMPKNANELLEQLKGLTPKRLKNLDRFLKSEGGRQGRGHIRIYPDSEVEKLKYLLEQIEEGRTTEEANYLFKVSKRPAILILQPDFPTAYLLKLFLHEKWLVHLADSAEDALRKLEKETIGWVITEAVVPFRRGSLAHAESVHPMLVSCEKKAISTIVLTDADFLAQSHVLVLRKPVALWRVLEAIQATHQFQSSHELALENR